MPSVYTENSSKVLAPHKVLRRYLTIYLQVRSIARLVSSLMSRQPFAWNCRHHGRWGFEVRPSRRQRPGFQVGIVSVGMDRHVGWLDVG